MTDCPISAPLQHSSEFLRLSSEADLLTQALGPSLEHLIYISKIMLMVTEHPINPSLSGQIKTRRVHKLASASKEDSEGRIPNILHNFWLLYPKVAGVLSFKVLAEQTPGFYPLHENAVAPT